ncbi:MAG: extensin family protein [Methyloceanibacter sp.]
MKASPSPEADPAPPEPKAKAPVPDPLSTPEAKFLRRVHQGACQVFSTVLGPEVNDVHRTHLHLDLQDRNALNVCE